MVSPSIVEQMRERLEAHVSEAAGEFGVLALRAVIDAHQPATFDGGRVAELEGELALARQGLESRDARIEALVSQLAVAEAEATQMRQLSDSLSDDLGVTKEALAFAVETLEAIASLFGLDLKATTYDSLVAHVRKRLEAPPAAPTPVTPSKPSTFVPPKVPAEVKPWHGLCSPHDAALAVGLFARIEKGTPGAALQVAAKVDRMTKETATQIAVRHAHEINAARTIFFEDGEEALNRQIASLLNGFLAREKSGVANDR